MSRGVWVGGWRVKKEKKERERESTTKQTNLEVRARSITLSKNNKSSLTFISMFHSLEIVHRAVLGRCGWRE